MLLSNLDLLATALSGVARLRELILTLAVQGKLVPQDPADEPVSVLLQKIRAEKDRLIAEGKIKRDKQLAEIAEEDRPFELPVVWEWVRFGEVLDFQGGGQPPKSNFSEIPLPDYVQLIQIRDLGDKPQPVYIPRKLASKFCTTSDVMVGRYGASVGKVFWGKDGAYNVALVKMVDEHQVFDRRFLFQLLLSPIGQSLFAGISRSAQDGFNKNDIEAKLIPLAPLAEQSRIVTRVEELMRLCDALEAKGRLEAAQHAQLVSTLLGALTASATPEELADHWQRVAQHFDLLLDRPEAIDALEQAMLQLAVRGLLVPQDSNDEPASTLLARIRTEKDRLIAEGQIKRDKPLPVISEEEKPFELPAEWEWVRLGEVSKVISGYAFSSEDFSAESGIRAIKITNAGVGEFHETDDYLPLRFATGFENFKATQNDLILALTRPYVSNGLKISRCPSSYEGALINQRVAAIRCSSIIVHEFAFTYMQSADVLSIYQNRFNGSGLQPNLKVSDVTGLAVPLPPLAEQSRIVTRVTALRRLCADLRQRLAERQSVQARLAEALVQEVA